MSIDQSKIEEWRSKALAGTLTADEMREAIQMLREGRITTVARRSATQKRVAAKHSTGEDLLAEIEAL